MADAIDRSKYIGSNYVPPQSEEAYRLDHGMRWKQEGWAEWDKNTKKWKQHNWLYQQTPESIARAESAWDYMTRMGVRRGFLASHEVPGRIPAVEYAWQEEIEIIDPADKPEWNQFLTPSWIERRKTANREAVVAPMPLGDSLRVRASQKKALQKDNVPQRTKVSSTPRQDSVTKRTARTMR
jgi:hypothetical protein